MGKEIDKRLLDKSTVDIETWEKKKKERDAIEYKNRAKRERGEELEPVPELQPQPQLRTFFIAVNNSTRALIDRLDANNGEGLLFDTETATLTNANRQDWGNSTEVYLKNFHNEFVSIDRKGGESIRIDEPAMGIFLSGTPSATSRLIPSAENGLFSRFIHYYFKAPAIWRTQRPSPKIEEREIAFRTASWQLDELHKALSSREEPLFVNLTNQQWSMIDDTFKESMEALNRSNADADLFANVKRCAVIAARISCILAVLRQFEANPFKSRSITPENVDVQCALAMTKTYLSHAIEIASESSGVLKSPSVANIKGRQLQFFNLLPQELFTATEYLTVAEQIEVKERTAQRWMQYFTKIGMLENPERGVYKKVVVQDGVPNEKLDKEINRADNDYRRQQESIEKKIKDWTAGDRQNEFAETAELIAVEETNDSPSVELDSSKG